ncbi:MAG TPA: competence type IV pilus ATPase ComGA [Pseudogracilibacillus sp.]|nr:competence type IV pilus ATPase ComGA [Pseudogracilibacillus sp.]
MTKDTSAFVERLFMRAFYKKATDIHFLPSSTYNTVAIYFRIFGDRSFIQRISLSFYNRMLTYVKFAANMDIGENKRPQNGTLTYSSKQTTYHLRLSTLPVQRLESLTVRIFPQSIPPPLEQLVLFSFQGEQIRKWLQHRSGILLFTGPTGSGKSTMMYSLVQELIKTSNRQVITLEEPIERQIENVLQVEINERAGITYEEGLRAALRHDPDVLLIGEIRDEHTAKFTIRSSLTGHLVLTTLHAKNIPGTIERLLDLGISRTDLSQTIVGIASLRLIPVIVRGEVRRRAAIIELIDGTSLRKLIEGKTLPKSCYYTFTQLKEKAWCYGFIDQKVLSET